VPTFTLYAVLRAGGPLDDAAVAALARVLRPEDEGLCIWRDGSERLLVSADCAADDLEGALEVGRELADEARALSPVPAAVEEIQAMTDEEVLVWRAAP
jgi:2-iminoacetate synthase ThiH